MPALLPFRFPGLDNIRCYFTTGLYGNIRLDDEAALARRQDLPFLLGFSNWTEMSQVHGNTLLVNPEATAPELSSPLEADGCCTDRRGQAMLVKSADCQPILLAHKSGKYIAALHVGWRGNVLNFPGQGVRDFCVAYDLAPEDVMAVRGPSLGPGAAEFVNFTREWPPEFSPWFNFGTRRMDLWSLTRQQLQNAGIKREHIYGLDMCTFTMQQLFFSYRAEQAGLQTGDKVGRQAALIYMK
ncbi:MAG: polyphenol oxidase family protein [Deltaproteobacteria bacterium]|nr:polyphenol oxidase family protein [Deltaproteobacteria bacterium]